MKHYATKWNLDSLIPRKKLMPFLNKIKKMLDGYKKEKKEPEQQILSLQKICSHIKEGESYTDCLLVQDVTDLKAKQEKNCLLQLHTEVEVELLSLRRNLANLSDKEFRKLLEVKTLKPICFFLQKERELAKELASDKVEELIITLAADGFHGWSALYQELIGSMRIIISRDGKKKSLSPSEAYNVLSHPDRKCRKEIFTQWEKACQEHAMSFSRTINHIAGFRLKVVEERGWESPLKEPLYNNNMSEKSLNAMWTALSNVKSILAPFYALKAKACGVKQCSWYDLEAPLLAKQLKRSYQTFAKEFSGMCAAYSKDMSGYVKHALENKWLDIEDRKNKAPGGFCASFPESKESRIYLAYSGTFHNDLVVAHELGHGYHNHVVATLPYFSQNYPMCLAEMASTFFEHITFEEYLKRAKSTQERQEILFEKVQRHTFLLQNIYARFLFEKELYKRRKQGFLLPDELSEIMVEAQEKAYGSTLKDHHAYFWITKLHFYLTDVSFYNFPYTIGYLLSLKVMQDAKENPQGFEERYRNLLLDSGRMTLEDIVKRHFNGDAATSEFWEEALQIVAQDVRALQEEMKK